MTVETQDQKQDLPRLFEARNPSLWRLSGKTLDVQGRKIVQLDCGSGHSLGVQFYVCTGISFPLLSVARLLLQDFGQ